jgi:anthranilate phosphoribosyltransferase
MIRLHLSTMLEALIRELEAGRALTSDQVSVAVAALVNETVSAQAKAGFLTALAAKGETTDEITSFARQLRELSMAPILDDATRAGEILDVCGTGGDRLQTFNISTTVALIVAAAGVAVAKHGNRAITSQCGSADVLERLGVRIDLDPTEAGEWLREHRFAFFFAPRYHPAFKQIAPARKLCAERGQRTIFNFLGPLLNPARPTAQLIGVPRPELCEPIARALQFMGVRRGMVVSGAVPGGDLSTGAGATAWLDELSTLGETTLAEFYQERGFHVSRLSPVDFGLQPARLADLAGGDPETNAEIVRAIVDGRDRGPRREAIMLNAAAALLVSGLTRSLVEGWEQAGHIIECGSAKAKLDELVAASKRTG